MAMYAERREFHCSALPVQSRSDAQAQNFINVRVEESRELGRTVNARRPLRAGEVAVIGYVVVVEPRRTHLSVQVGWNRHVLMQEPAVVINHACDPNTRVMENRFGAYDFVAIKDIPMGAEITYDYATTEFEPHMNFTCYCYSRECRGDWGGFVSLPDDNLMRRRGYIAGYLRDWDASLQSPGPGQSRAARLIAAGSPLSQGGLSLLSGR